MLKDMAPLTHIHLELEQDGKYDLLNWDYYDTLAENLPEFCEDINSHQLKYSEPVDSDLSLVFDDTSKKYCVHFIVRGFESKSDNTFYVWQVISVIEKAINQKETQ